MSDQEEDLAQQSEDGERDEEGDADPDEENEGDDEADEEERPKTGASQRPETAKSRPETAKSVTIEHIFRLVCLYTFEVGFRLSVGRGAGDRPDRPSRQGQ